MARHRNANGDIVNWYRGIVQNAQEAAVEELEVAMREGAELTIGYISTRGTAKSGKEGRIESGDMVRDVTHRVDRLSGNRARGFFGWLNAPNTEDKKYYVYQEGGFEHAGSGQLIEGMYALADAAAQAFSDYKKRAGAAIQRAGFSQPKTTKRMF